MKKVNLLSYSLGVLFLVFSFLSCLQVHCPAFPESETEWYPYRVGETLRFACGDDTMKLPVLEYWVSESYSFSNRCDCECESGMSFKTGIDSLNSVKIEANIGNFHSDINQLPPPIDIRFQWYVYNNQNMLIPMEDDIFYVHETTESFYYDSLEVNGKIFTEVVDLLGLDDNIHFTELKVAKGVGIIELTQNNSIVWNVVLD